MIAKLTEKSRVVVLAQMFTLEIAELTAHRLESSLQVIFLAALH